MLSTPTSHGTTAPSAASSVFDLVRLFRGKGARASPEPVIPDITITHVDVSILPDTISVSSFPLAADSSDIKRVQEPSLAKNLNVGTPFTSGYLAYQSLSVDQELCMISTTPSCREIPLRRMLSGTIPPSIRSRARKSIPLGDRLLLSPSANQSDDQDPRPTIDKESMVLPEADMKAIQSTSIRYPAESSLERDTKIQPAPSVSWLRQHRTTSPGYIAQTMRINFMAKLAKISGILVAGLSSKFLVLKADTSGCSASDSEEERDIRSENGDRPWYEILEDLERDMDPFAKLGR